MIRLTLDEVRIIRMKVATRKDGRCRSVDDDGCRCLRRDRDHVGPHDYGYTPWDATLEGMKSGPA